jgi:hypothetical protein
VGDIYPSNPIVISDDDEVEVKRMVGEHFFMLVCVHEPDPRYLMSSKPELSVKTVDTQNERRSRSRSRNRRRSPERRDGEIRRVNKGRSRSRSRTRLCAEGENCKFLNSSIGCKFLHTAEQIKKAAPLIPCKWGRRCVYLDNGPCDYFHGPFQRTAVRWQPVEAKVEEVISSVTDVKQFTPVSLAVAPSTSVAPAVSAVSAASSAPSAVLSAVSADSVVDAKAEVVVASVADVKQFTPVSLAVAPSASASSMVSTDPAALQRLDKNISVSKTTKVRNMCRLILYIIFPFPANPIVIADDEMIEGKYPFIPIASKKCIVERVGGAHLCPTHLPLLELSQDVIK